MALVVGTRESSRSRAAPSLGRSATKAGGAFVGDGLYAGDGGAQLERLWRLAAERGGHWRPLPGCDGRWVARKLELERCAPEEVARAAVPAAGFDSACVRGAAEETDAIVVVRLVGGGGLLSFVKPDGRFVHTCNTESGLCRKLLALGPGAADALERAVRAGAAGGRGAEADRARWLVRSTCGVLACLDDARGERTRAAPAASVALRRGLARAALGARGRRKKPRAAETDAVRSLVSDLLRGVADRAADVSERNTCTKELDGVCGLLHTMLHANTAGRGGDREAPPPPPPPPRSRGT